MKLSQWLEARRMTQARFADRIGVSVAAVSRYVSGHRIPDGESMRRIAWATRAAVMPEDFLGIDAKAARRGEWSAYPRLTT